MPGPWGEVTSPFPTFCPSNSTFSSSPTFQPAYATSAQMHMKWKCYKWSMGFQEVVHNHVSHRTKKILIFFFIKSCCTWLRVDKGRSTGRGVCVYVCWGGAEVGWGESLISGFRITCIILVGISVIFSGTSLNGGNTLKEKTKRTTVINYSQVHSKWSCSLF